MVQHIFLNEMQVLGILGEHTRIVKQHEEKQFNTL